jgi:predicted N-formylglutamate amidohydrolase
LEALPQAGAATGAIGAVAVENRGGAGGFVIVCDHASNRFPPEFGFLGLSPADLDAHIAWDPGALGVARNLSRLLDAPLVYGTVLRLILDCNRPLDAPDLIAPISESTPIPGNAALVESERRRRIAAIHEPFHRAVDEVVEGRLNAGRATTLIAVHSFTPVYRGVPRPWEIGILFDRSRRLADVLITGLEADGLNVGVNQPYSPADRVYYTLSRHAEARGLDCAMIEIRNDLVRTQDSELEWAERIGRIASAADRAGINDMHSTGSRGQSRAVRRA